jgi:hypothetical protein
MLCTFTPFFQDVDALKRRVKNNHDLGLVGLYYDGPFIGYPHEETYSTDGSRDIIQKYPNQLLFDVGKGTDTSKKMNHALHVAVKMGFDSFLTLGSDEWIEGDVYSFYKNINWEFPINNVPFIEYQPKMKYNRQTGALPRLITMPMFVRLRETHWVHFFNDKPYVKEESPLTRGITIYHDDSIRTLERNQIMEKYQDWNVEREKKIIREKYMSMILKGNYPPVKSKHGIVYYSCGCINKAGQWFNVCLKHRGERI